MKNGVWALVLVACCVLPAGGQTTHKKTGSAKTGATTGTVSAETKPAAGKGQSGPPPAQTPTQRKLSIVEGITIALPSGWAPSGIIYANAYELVSPPPWTGKSSQARTLITVEHRIHHAEAVQRLAEVGVKTPTTFLPVSNWPALRRRYSAPLPQVARLGDDSPQRPRIALRTTTAVAVGNLLLRLDTTLAPGANSALADEADAMADKITITSVAPLSPSQTQQEILKLRRRAIRTMNPIAAHPSRPEQAAASRVSSGKNIPSPQRSAALASPGPVGEIEISASHDGTTVVIASNSGVAVSNDSGATFPKFIPQAGFFTFPNAGDPSVAVGVRDLFYMSYVGRPDGTAGAGGVTGCAVSVARSTDSGATFRLSGHVGFCALTGSPLCTPDQEHIAADRTTVGTDNVYAVWRNFSPVGTPPANCAIPFSGTVIPTIACSTNGGTIWGAPVVIGAGDRPRVTVGPDGFVYVVQIDGSNVMLYKFQSCVNGLAPVRGFPVTVTALTEPTCPVAGLDRCDGPTLASPMVAADDTDAMHLYLAFAQTSSGGGDDIVVMDSNDGGVHWNPGIIVNSVSTTRHFMPWVCSSGGAAFVSWYDRRSATSAKNDLTDYFQGKVAIHGGRLTVEPERNLSSAPDPQCASGWPGNVDNPSDSDSCSIQPQLAGVCTSPAGGGSGTRCDFDEKPCPKAGESCTAGGGRPKYGDYNGSFCAGSRVFSAWASATAPAGVVGAGGGIQVFDDALFLPTEVTAVLQVVPPADPGRFNLQLDGNTVVSSVADGGQFTQTVATGSHTVHVTNAQGTNLADYSVSYGLDCASNGTDGVVFVPTAAGKVCDIGVRSKALVDCNQACANDLADCLAGRGGPSKQGCANAAKACQSACQKATLTVTETLVPASDPGRFTLKIDGVPRGLPVGNGGSRTLTTTPGAHTVGEQAAGNTNAGSYTTTIGGDCDANGNVALTYGDEANCTITNTSTSARLTVQKVLTPANDSGRFDLQVDQITRANGVGDGGTTAPLVIPPGLHTVGELAIAGTDAANYHVMISGDCNPDGSVTIKPGDDKLCIIANAAKPSCVASCQQECEQACVSECKLDRDDCSQQANQPGRPPLRVCAQNFKACSARCVSPAEARTCLAQCQPQCQ